MITFSNHISYAPNQYGNKFFGMYSKMDYLSLGSTGFAQLGEPQYDEKLAFELPFILNMLKEEFGMYPESLPNIKVELMPNEHDFGCYHDFVVIYNRVELDNLEVSEDDADLQKFEDVWDWLNRMEAFDWDAAEQIIKDKWFEQNGKIIQLKAA